MSDKEKSYTLLIYFDDGPMVFLDKTIPCESHEAAKILWKRQYGTRRYGSVFSEKEGKVIEHLVPLRPR